MLPANSLYLLHTLGEEKKIIFLAAVARLSVPAILGSNLSARGGLCHCIYRQKVKMEGDLNIFLFFSSLCHVLFMREEGSLTGRAE